MCEYCEKPNEYICMDFGKDGDPAITAQLKYNHLVIASRGTPPLFANSEINYCPMCGRRLGGTARGNHPLINTWIDTEFIERSCNEASSILSSVVDKINDFEIDLENLQKEVNK